MPVNDVLDADDLKRRLARYRAVLPTERPKVKSTKLCIRDFSRLTGMQHQMLFWFLKGDNRIGKRLGKKRLGVLKKWLDLADGGYIQKLQWKKYIVHDTPFKPPLVEMRVCFGKDGPLLNFSDKQKAVREFPDFSKIFEGKK